MKPNWYCSALYVLFKLEDSSPRLPIEQAPAVGCPHIFGWIFFLCARIPILCSLGRKEKKTDSISPNKILTVSVWYSPGSRHHFGKSQQQQQPVAEDYPDAFDNSKQIFFALMSIHLFVNCFISFHLFSSFRLWLRAPVLCLSILISVTNVVVDVQQHKSYTIHMKNTLWVPCEMKARE